MMNNYFTINHVSGNSVTLKSAIRSYSDYTEEELQILEAGGEIEDYDGEIISMYFEEE